MSNLFSTVLNMSMTGSVVILLVMLARLILKRAPKIFSYALWSVVLFRLLCPVAFTAPVSVLNALEPDVQEASESTSVVYFIPAEVNQNQEFTFVPVENQSGTELVQAGETEHTRLDLMTPASYIWISGTAIMILYSVFQYIRLRLKLVGAMAYRGNVYRADYIDTPFVMGVFSPKIYLPSDVPMNERKYIIAHERHHIRRCDHIIKLLAYLALCIHWFNPLVWAAFILAGKDMEMSCDEAVIRKMGSQIRADYSASLLRLATHKKIIAGMPLAFGEGDTKGRVMNMAKWKKPAKWFVAICVILCICVVVVCAFNPEEEKTIEELTRHTSDGSVDTAVGDLCFIYPGGLTSEQRDVDNWTAEDTLRSKSNLPSRRPYSSWFIDNGVDFGGVVDFIVPEDREIRLEEMNLPSEWQGLDYIAGSSTYPYVEMEYTLIKEGKDFIQMYLYTYSGRGYFLWFYTEQGDSADKLAILESVELGKGGREKTKTERDEEISLGLFNLTIPKGYGYYRNEAVILEITKQDIFHNQTVLGCVTARPNPNLPLETDGDWVDWVEAVGLDLHLDDPKYGYTITDNGEFGDISLTLEEMSDELLLTSERHYFYIVGDLVYHLWFDAMQMSWAEEKAILESIWIKDAATVPNDNKIEAALQQPIPTVSGTDIATDIQLVQYGDFYSALPDGMEATEENGVIALTVDAKTVGGIALRHPEQSASPDAFSEAWQTAMGVPEASDSTMGYIGGGSLYADYETTYFPDMPVNRDDNGNIIQDEIGTYVLENEVTHYFFVNGTDIYDLWFYIHRLPSTMRETVLKSCFIEGVTDLAAMQSALNEEKETLEQCRKVVESVQAGGYHVIFNRSDKNGPVPYETEFLENGEDWLTITASNLITGETEQIAHLYANGRFFSNQGHLSDAELIWEEVLGAEINGTDGFVKPWLASFPWREEVISYQGTLERDGERSVMLRIDEPYPYGYDSNADNYFVTFTFDSDGRFLDVYIQCNVFMDNAFTETESIISLDSETVNAEIQKEYQKAIG